MTTNFSCLTLNFNFAYFWKSERGSRIIALKFRRTWRNLLERVTPSPPLSTSYFQLQLSTFNYEKVYNERATHRPNLEGAKGHKQLGCVWLTVRGNSCGVTNEAVSLVKFIIAVMNSVADPFQRDALVSTITSVPIICTGLWKKHIGKLLFAAVLRIAVNYVFYTFFIRLESCQEKIKRVHKRTRFHH